MKTSSNIKYTNSPKEYTALYLTLGAIVGSTARTLSSKENKQVDDIVTELEKLEVTREEWEEA